MSLDVVMMQYITNLRKRWIFWQLQMCNYVAYNRLL